MSTSLLPPVQGYYNEYDGVDDGAQDLQSDPSENLDK